MHEIPTFLYILFDVNFKKKIMHNKISTHLFETKKKTISAYYTTFQYVQVTKHSTTFRLFFRLIFMHGNA
jgi:hypothetical protein